MLIYHKVARMCVCIWNSLLKLLPYVLPTNSLAYMIASNHTAHSPQPLSIWSGFEHTVHLFFFFWQYLQLWVYKQLYYKNWEYNHKLVNISSASSAPAQSSPLLHSADAYETHPPPKIRDDDARAEFYDDESYLTILILPILILSWINTWTKSLNG